MMKNLDIKYLVGGIACVLLGFGMMQGTVQRVITFADPINEIFFTALTFMMAIGMFACVKNK
jgi:hypothetical protein